MTPEVDLWPPYAHTHTCACATAPTFIPTCLCTHTSIHVQEEKKGSNSGTESGGPLQVQGQCRLHSEYPPGKATARPYPKTQK